MSNKQRFKEVMEKKIGKISGGKSMFTKNDIRRGRNQLDILLRKIIVENNISKAQYDEAFKKYSDNDGIHPASLANRKGNLLKTILIGRVSFKKFIEAVCGVFGFKIINIEITFKKPNGSIYKASLED